MFKLAQKDKKKTHTILEFEKPLYSLATQIEELENTQYNNDCESSIEGLKKEFNDLKTKIYKNLSPAQKLQIARHPDRPYTLDYVKYLGENWIELHGDREGHDDGAVVGGLITIENQTFMVVGTDKGHNIKDKQKRNFGMPQPWGYRKALRLFRHAEKFNIPIVTLVDTPGAFPGLEAEELGQSGAIATNIQELFNIKVPVITIITGEGGSGGALALGVADHVALLEYSVYSVISPEGCAAILWRSRDYSQEAAQKLKITAPELKELGLIDEVIEEPTAGAHHNHEEIAANVKKMILKKYKELKKKKTDKLLEDRYQKYCNYGFFSRSATNY